MQLSNPTQRSLTDPAHKIDRKFAALAHFEKYGWSYPLSAEIDLTWRCALNCFMCHSKHLHANVELSAGDIHKILQELHSHGCKAITWSGGGEPLENPCWKYAMTICGELGMDQALYSYLPAFNQERADFLADNLKFVYTHSVSTKGIERPNRDCVWTYGYLLDSSNWHKIPDLIAKVDFNFFNFVDFRPLSPINAPDPPDIDYSWVPRAIEILDSITERDKRVKQADYKFHGLLRKDKGRDYSCCYSTDFTTTIGPDGTVYECVNRRNISPLGNLLHEPLEDIWQRKAHTRTDLKGCRILCRNNEMNRSLVKLLGPSPMHENFI